MRARWRRSAQFVPLSAYCNASVAFVSKINPKSFVSLSVQSSPRVNKMRKTSAKPAPWHVRIILMIYRVAPPPPLSLCRWRVRKRTRVCCVSCRNHLSQWHARSHTRTHSIIIGALKKKILAGGERVDWFSCRRRQPSQRQAHWSQRVGLKIGRLGAHYLFCSLRSLITTWYISAASQGKQTTGRID